MFKKYNIKNRIGERGWLCGAWIKKDSGFYPYLSTEKLEVAYMRFDSKTKGKKHYHKKADEFLLILKGSLKEEINGEIVEFKRGDFAVIKSGSITQLKEAQDKTIAIIVKAPSALNDKHFC